MRPMVLDIEIGKQNDSSVRSQEDQHMPEAMEIWKTHGGPGFA